MKKIILALFCASTVSLTSNAQLPIAAVGGINIANMSVKSGGNSETTTSNTLFHIGLSTQFV